MRIYAVYHPDYGGDDSYEIHARSHDDAASSYAEEYGSEGDYPLAEDNTEEIDVEDVATKERKRFRIGSYTKTVYTSDEIPQKGPPDVAR